MRLLNSEEVEALEKCCDDCDDCYFSFPNSLANSLAERGLLRVGPCDCHGSVDCMESIAGTTAEGNKALRIHRIMLECGT